MKKRKSTLKEYAVILSGTDWNGDTDVETLFTQARTVAEARKHGLMQTELEDPTIVDCVAMGAAVEADDAFTMEFFTVDIEEEEIA